MATRVTFNNTLSSGDNSLCTAISAGMRSTVVKCFATNNGASPVTVYVNLVNSGGSVDSTNKYESKTLQSGESYPFPGIVGVPLDPGMVASANASAGSAVNLIFALSDKS